MRKKLLLMFAVAAMFVASAMGQNLVPNGNMDAWSNEASVPDGYLRSGVSAVQMTRVEGRGGSGYATRFQTSSYTGNGSNRLWSPEFPMSQPGTYKVSFWVKGDGRMATLRVVASNTTANGGTGELATNVAISVADWTRMEYNFSSFASPVAYVCFVFDKPTGGSDTDVSLDDISVEFVSSKITNGDMSAWANASGLADGYSRSGTNDLTGVLISQTEGHGGAGDYATRFQTTSFTANNTNRFWSPGFAITKMGTYKVTFWVKGTGNLSYLRMTYGANSAEGVVIAGSGGNYPVTEFNFAEWTQVSYTFASYFQPKTSANYGQLYAKYYFCFVFNKATTAISDTDILLDDISVEYISDELMQNGNMEMWSDGNSPVVPNNYIIGTQTDVANSFSKGAGRGGSGNSMHIQNIYSATNSATNRIFSPYVVGSATDLYCLDSTKTYRLSFWLKGEGRLQYLYVLNSTSSLNNQPITQLVGPTTGGFDFNYADWTQVYYDFIPTRSTLRNIAMIIGGQTIGTKSDAYLDDISIKEYLSDDATLKILAIPDLGNESDTSLDFVLPGFDQNEENYTVPLWFGSTTVPDLRVTTNHASASYTVDYGGSTAFVSGSNTKIVRVIVKAQDLTTTKTYTVTFDRTDFIAGFPYNFSTATSPFAQTLPGYRNAGKANSHGDYWGSSTYRPNSNTGGELTTHKLINGAGTVTFWTGNRSGSYASGTEADARMLLKVSYTTDDGALWTNVDSIQVDTTALHGKWTKVSYDIKKTDPNTQVKFEYIKMEGASKFVPVDIDDIRITPWLGTDIPEIKIKPFVALNIYPQGQAIVVAEEGRYMIYTVSGQLIASGNNTGQVMTIPVKSGLYIAKSGNQAKKLVVK